MNSLRRQIVTLLTVWLVAFPLPPLSRINFGRFLTPQAAAQANIGTDQIRDVNHSVWQSLFGQPFDDNTSIYWLDEVLTSDETYATGTTPSGNTFALAISDSRYSQGIGNNSDRLEVCAAVLVSALAMKPVVVFVVTSSLPGDLTRRSRVMVVGELPSDSVLFSNARSAATTDSESDALAQFLRETEQAAPADPYCSSRCRALKILRDALTEALYNSAKSAAEAELDRLVDAAGDQLDLDLADAQSNFNNAIAGVAIVYGIAIAGCFASGPAFWLCQATAIALAAAATLGAMLARAAAVLAARNRYDAAVAAASAQFDERMMQARRDRDARTKFAEGELKCCLAACEGVECDPLPSLGPPPTQQ